MVITGHTTLWNMLHENILDLIDEVTVKPVLRTNLLSINSSFFELFFNLTILLWHTSSGVSFETKMAFQSFQFSSKAFNNFGSEKNRMTMFNTSYEFLTLMKDNSDEFCFTPYALKNLTQVAIHDIEGAFKTIYSPFSNILLQYVSFSIPVITDQVVKGSWYLHLLYWYSTSAIFIGSLYLSIW